MIDTTKPILTITGSDSTSESGIQADIKTISELGGYAVTAITSITVQTTLGIQEFYDLPAKIVEGQIEAIMNDMQPEVMKIGMIRRMEILEVLVKVLKQYRPKHVIYDPVVRSSKGDALMSEDLMLSIVDKLFPLTTEVIRLNDVKNHGLRNRYSSALAVFLNNGETIEEARKKAREYVLSSEMKESNLRGRAKDLYLEFQEAVVRHVGKNNDVQYYADNLNVSARYLAQVTRRIADKTPKMIIDDHLIGKVELMLKTTRMTMQEIANECGFSSQAHLTNFFKKLNGISPKEYRKNNY